MKNNENAKKKADSVRSWLLVLVPVCIVLFLISCFMLGTLLYNMATRDKYAVEMEIGTHNVLELFSIAYEDSTGEVVVKGTNGEDVVAPGLEVNNTVRLENRDNIAIDYILTCEAAFYNEYQIPLQIRLTDGDGNYILGSDTEWVDILELNDLKHRGTIPEGAFEAFGISWRWQYETGEKADDVYDTFLGDLEGGEVPGITVEFHTDSIASEELSPKHVFLHKYSYGCCICCYLVWLLLIISLILLLYVWKYQKKLKASNEQLEQYELLYGHLPESAEPQQPHIR